MDTIDQLSIALGFATLAGLNLYLTVLITGLAIRFNWVALAEQYDQLAVLGSPAVIIASGVFFCAEFFSDKIPWVDSAWDTVHTLIRPIGGALLAIKTLGATDPAFEVIIAMLAGSATLLTHGVKAGTRLAVNTSPEPVSNIAVSTAEDAAVIGGLTLMAISPIIAGGVALVFLVVSAWFAPKMFRRMRAFGWLLKRRLFAPAVGEEKPGDEVFQGSLSDEEELVLRAAIGAREPDVRWVAHCVTGRSKKFAGVTAQTFGKLVAECGGDDGADTTLRFVGRRRWRNYHADISLDGVKVHHDSRLLSEDVVLSGDSEKDCHRRLVLRFPRSQREIAKKVVEELSAMQNALPVRKEIETAVV